jgi:hypothetical protein
MVRALRPYIAFAVLTHAAAGVAYGLGAPAWTAYATIMLTVLVVLFGYDRWDRRQYPR